MKKHAYRILALAFALALVLSLSGSAFAQSTAAYPSTRTVLDYFDEIGIYYDYSGVSDSGYDRVTVGFSMDNYDSADVELFFPADGSNVSLRVWDIVVCTAGKSYVTSTLNSLNADYKYVKFVYDESDSTVQAEIDMYIDPEHCGRPVYDAVSAIITVIDSDGVAAQLHSLE